jgi:serine/threonine protein kinase
VVTVFDVGEHEGRPYLVMELLTGRDLATELAEKGPLSISAVCHLVGQAAVGLDTAHRAGVVHRDVKPANLHQSADGRLKVVDFGTARSTTEAAMRLTSVGSVIGTAAYLSPEQILGEAGDAASDLYALGCVCYELLCGRPPFVGSPTEMIFHHVHSLPDSPRRYRPDIPAELERLVLALLRKDPAVRPASGDVVRQVLATVARQVMPPARDTATFPTASTSFTAPTAFTAAPGSPAEPWTAKIMPDRPRSRMPGRRAGAAMGLAAALVIAVLWASASSDPAEPPVSAISPVVSAVLPPATPSAPPSPPPTVSQNPSATPAPPPVLSSPSPQSMSGGWQTRLSAFSRAVTDQERQGGINPRLARETRERIGRLARKIQEGKDGDARDELSRLGRDLVEARRRGRLASTGPLISFLQDSGLTFASDDRKPDDGRRHGHDDDRDDDD